MFLALDLKIRMKIRIKKTGDRAGGCSTLACIILISGTSSSSGQVLLPHVNLLLEKTRKKMIKRIKMRIKKKIKRIK